MGRRSTAAVTITTSTTVRRIGRRSFLSECISHYCSFLFIKAWLAAVAPAMCRKRTSICAIASEFANTIRSLRFDALSTRPPGTGRCGVEFCWGGQNAFAPSPRLCLIHMVATTRAMPARVQLPFNSILCIQLAIEHSNHDEIQHT